MGTKMAALMILLLVGTIGVLFAVTGPPSRSLTDEQTARFAIMVAKQGGGSVTIYPEPDDREAAGYATRWQRVFEGALWTAPIEEWKLTPTFGRPGVVLVLPADDQRLRTLVEAAAAEGVQFVVETDPKATTANLFVGRRP